MYKAFSYMAFFGAAVFVVAAFYAYPYLFVPVAVGCGYLGSYLRSKV